MKAVLVATFCFLFQISIQAQNYKSLQEEASTACEQGNFPKAIELSEKALQVARSDKKTEAEELLSLRSENASYYLLNEQVEKGLILFTNLIEEIEANKNYPKAELNIRQNYGIALVFLAYYTDALPHLKRALELSQSIHIKAQDKNAILGSMAVCYQAQYDFVKAEEVYKEAIDVCKKENLLNTSDYAYLLNNVALLYVDMQMDEKALTYYQQAEKIYNKTKDTLNPQFPVFLSEYGVFMANAARYEEALQLMYRVKRIDQQMYDLNSFEYANTLNNLGFIYSKMNKIMETEQFYEQSIKIKSKEGFVRIGSYLTSINNLMVFYASVGRKEEAREKALLLEEGLKNKSFTDTLKRATFANNLGVEYMQYENYEKAFYYFKDALAYYEAVYGPDNDFKAEIYVNMGTLFQVQDKLEDCAVYLNKAADEYKKRSVDDNAGNINTLCNLAAILHNLNKPDLAEPIVNKAFETAKKFNVTQSDVLEQLYLSKAQNAADLDQVKQSMEYFNKYLDLKYKQIEQNFSYMTETEKMYFLEQFELNIKNFYTTIINNIDKYPELIKTLLDFRIKTKAFLLNNLSKIKQAINAINDPLLNEKFEQLKLKRESSAKLLSFDTQAYPYALVEASSLKSEADILEKEISARVSGMDLVNHATKTDWRSIQKQLAPNEAAIEIFQSHLIYETSGKGTNYTYLIIRSNGNPIAVSINRELSWENEVLNLYRNSIDLKKDEPDLYRRLWQAVDEKLVGVTTIFVSPDGIYNQINLNTLFNASTKKYVIEEKNIHLLSSLRDLSELKQAKLKKPEYSVLFGNPRFDYDISKLTNNKNDVSTSLATRGAYGFVLSELPGTKTEVTLIKNTLEKSGLRTVVFSEEKANEAELKKIKNPDVLHLATHGFFLEDVKDADLAGYAKVEKEFYQNPMMRSGIFLSGANKTYEINTGNVTGIKDFEDGMLTAFEAMNLSLDKTELVVLSACETGLGKVKNGEGVYGLQRAFKLAGAKAIIMSLWPVSDEATKDLMISFYSSWSKSGDLYAAFKEAQLDLKKKYPEPYYWGAFILNGK